VPFVVVLVSPGVITVGPLTFSPSLFLATDPNGCRQAQRI